MSMTDPIADMLTRIRNASRVRHSVVRMPGSKIKTELARILKEEGYIEGFSVSPAEAGPGTVLEIQLRYVGARNRECAINGITRVSKPGLRVYTQAASIQRVFGGMGVAVLSTSRGLMTDRDARRAGVGGEVICHVW
ncbi:MAG: 30S ribosomal protein S8 [Ferrimicrobium sp.]|uniref:Small ribosomal subunit protein uS8 n=1 Tax=Ferrimicrobium acidiphilum TaxID=121039 RepID=A0ABV3XYZ2_9ACTN|nr:30S ribosomal protein S8 [Ferrimicrobium sp.]